MWIEGRRRGGSKDLSKHLQKEENESVDVREVNGFAFLESTKANLEKALRQMEAIGYGKGTKRNLYHAIVAPAYGCTLSAAETKFMIDYYTEQMGFEGHQRAVVEHWKNGKQHFHMVFNIIHPITGKIHELKWTKLKEWRVSRELEKAFGHPPPIPKGKGARPKDMQRGKRSGIDPTKMRREVTSIFNASKTTREFITSLDKAGYALTKGRRNQLVLVDRFGDTHGLMRRIEGKKLSDLRSKFPGIETLPLPKHASLVRGRKAKNAATRKTTRIRPRKNYSARTFNSGFVKQSPVIPMPALHRYAPVRAAFAKAAWFASTPKQTHVQPNRTPVEKKGWPIEAIVMWEQWGRKNPVRFFSIWPELLPENFVLNPHPN